MKFACTSCSACCKRIGLVIEQAKQIGFPYGVNEKGWCEKLGENGLCMVYETRPDMCNIEKMYKLNFSQSGKTEKQVFGENAKLCNSYIIADGLDAKFLVDEKQYQ